MKKLWIAAAAMAGGWLILVPDPLGAWGPATHVALGEVLLNSLYLLPPAIRILLEAHPIEFLYGSVAADISFGKKYVPEGRHSHFWHVGEEILNGAPNDALRAAGYGYLAHLAADTIAHNTLVPQKHLLTRTGKPHGHTYWEHRMDLHVGEEYLGKARRLVLNYDHSAADEHFDRVLSHTLFSHWTNRRIFKGMIRAQDNDRWKQVFDRVLRNSRYDLPDSRVQQYLGYSFDYIVEYFQAGTEARARKLDPIGALNLRIAKKLRRAGRAEGGSQDPQILDELADRFFPLPKGPQLYWPKAQTSKKGGLLQPGAGRSQK